ncbi:MAG TPA: ABC transporter substrate-binding protein [Stellaceae bacterium]|nr:ABC transporter substrate-binding protein [Stellaceae bacterium]
MQPMNWSPARIARGGLKSLITGAALIGVLVYTAAPAAAQNAAPPAPAATPAAAPAAAPTLKLGIVTFLSGPAAGPFGIPARNAAELVTEAINKGTLPAPYNTKGFGGAEAQMEIVDEAGSTTEVVQSFRNLVQRQNVNAVVGYISSGSCLAVAPVAEELKMLTVFFDCGTPRIFEDAKYNYVFRTSATSTMDNVAAVRYLKAKFPNDKSYAGINQNYAWGQDSWRDFDGSMKDLFPNDKQVVSEFPKLFAGQYDAEISTLLVDHPDIVHSSFWGGDLESFMLQASARGLEKRSRLVLTTGETTMFRLRGQIPNGVILGARGPYGVLAHKSALNDWFRKNFQDRYNTPPVYSAYQMAQAILGLKVAYDKAANGKGVPTTDAVRTALTGLKYESFGTHVDMALGDGHQAVTETAYGEFKFDKKTDTPEIVNVVYYPEWCVNPPPGVKSSDWIQGGMKGAKCD